MVHMRRQQSVRTPEAWHASLSGTLPPSSDPRSVPIVRRFDASPGTFAQPALDAHVVALHLGGPKRVHRSQGTRRWVHDVQLGSMTVMPAYQANQWHTVGPIEFAHLVLGLGALDQIVVEEFDRDPAAYQLHDTVGLVDPLLEQVFRALLAHEGWVRRRLHLEALLTVFSVALLKGHSALSERCATAGQAWQVRGGLAGWQLRRVTEYMQAHLSEDVGLGGLAGLTGLSRAHFFRAFRQSTGCSPGQFLAEMRIRHARLLLGTSSLTMDEVAGALGFHHQRHFASAFSKRVGVSPRLYRARFA